MDDVTTRFPGEAWETCEPEGLGIKAKDVDKAMSDILAIPERAGILMVKDGRIIGERYERPDTTKTHIYSITKGLGATLVGIAVRQGIIRTTDRIRDWLPVHHPDIAPDAEVRHVLNMSAGTEPAGNAWRYNSNYILNSIPGILWQASGERPVDFYNKYLKAPLGLSFDWPSNDRGWIQIGSQGPLPVIEASHQDLARLGLLWLRRGMWGGVEIMPSSYVDEALTPTYPHINGAYGYLWWLNSAEGNYVTTGKASGAGSWFANAAPDDFMALGARGKVMIVVPQHNFIMVSLGDTAQEQAGNYLSTMMRAVYSLF
jgi:CubicO group peptidase (beta-lactamase class C family)